MILSGIQAFGDGYGFYLNKTRFPLKSVAGMTKNGVLQEAQIKGIFLTIIPEIIQKSLIISILQEYLLLPVATCQHMVNPVRELR
jgi:hypothetical protein